MSRTQLPPYEPPHLPLSSTTLHDLSLLPSTSSGALPGYLKSALTFLTDSAAHLSDPLYAPSTHADLILARSELLDRLETSVRTVCDAMAKTEFNISAVTEVEREERDRPGGMTAEMRRAVRRGEMEAVEEVEPQQVGSLEGLVGRWKGARRRDWSAYEEAGEQMKYGERNEYLSYREAIAEARGEKFSKNKNLFGSGSNTPNDDDDDDSDIEIAAEQRSFNCPITMRPFIHPVTSKKCTAHTFEKEAIMGLINQARDIHNRRKTEIKCPVSGCGNSLCKEDLEDDDRMARLMEKEKRREERERRERLLRVARGEESEGGEGSDEEMGGVEQRGEDWEGTQREIKKEKQSGNLRRKKKNKVVDLSDDEDEDME